MPCAPDTDNGTYAAWPPRVSPAYATESDASAHEDYPAELVDRCVSYAQHCVQHVRHADVDDAAYRCVSDDPHARL